MDEDELSSLIDLEVHQSIGFYAGDLSEQRRKALAYYHGQPFGNEVEGRSQVVSHDVADTVEWIMPSLIKIFTSNDEIVRFDPQGPEDENAAKQATDYINYIFWRLNRGFVAMYSFIKDALLQKNGFVKIYWDAYEDRKTETYEGLDDMQLQILLQELEANFEVEIREHETVEGVPLPGPDGQPVPQQLHNLKFHLISKQGKVCVEPVPPEEVLVNKRATGDLQKCRFVAHRCKKTISDLRIMGLDVDEIRDSDFSEAEFTLERQERFRTEEDSSVFENETTDKSMREVWVTEAYPLVDFDGDGIAERRIVIMVGKKILYNEEIDRVPLVTMTPILMPHKLFGKSIADLVMDLQLIKSTVFRQVLDNMYLTNNGRMMVLDGMANIDDLLTVRPGGIVRVKAFDAVKPLQAPPLGAPAFQLLGYIDSVRENRTGVRYFQGIDANALDKQVSGAAIDSAMMASQGKIELIARIMAETGIKDMFWAILELVQKHSTKPQQMRLSNTWEQVDPREWSTKFDMTVSVGLGTGSQDQKAQHAMGILTIQEKMALAGLAGLVVTPQNSYEAAMAFAKAGDPKGAEKYFTNPQGQQVQPKPDPKIELAKEKMGLQDKQKRDMKAVDVVLEGARMVHEEKLADKDKAHDGNMKALDMVHEGIGGLE